MRLLILFLLIVFGCKLQGQFAQFMPPDEPRIKIPGVHDSILEKNYNIKSVEKKLLRAKRLTLAGAILTPLSVGLEAIGWIVFATSKEEPSTQFFAGKAFVIGAPFVFAAGIASLPISIHMKHKWRIVQKDLQLHSGILSNGHVGLALNF